MQKSRLVEHLALQDKLNRVINPEWRSAGYFWQRAILVEAVELLDHIGWKWWKKQGDFDQDQACLELVDIWHFILSERLGRSGDINKAASDLALECAVPVSFVHGPYFIVDLNHTDLRRSVEMLAGMAAFGEVSIPAFCRVMDHLQLTWQRLHELYLAKNVLNLFRQAHGYKEGTYVKTWHGQEDNVVLANLIADRPDATAEQLLTKLEFLYPSTATTQS